MGRIFLVDITDKHDVATYYSQSVEAGIGFHRKRFEGFGLDPRIRHIVNAFVGVPNVVG
jgi:hypothetical protein